jgi:hypothetical protein
MPSKKVIDPRGPGPIEQLEIMEGGQQNIIDYSDKEPLLFQAGENSSHEYPGKIVVNNEPERVLAVNDFTKYGTTNKSGEDATGADTTEPTLPTGSPGLYEIDHNAHGLNFNSKIVWDENEEDLLELVSVPGSAVEQAVATDCDECQRKSNEEYIMESYDLQEAFVEGDHPRAPAGTGKGGQFVAKDESQEGGEKSGQQKLKHITMIQGQEVPVTAIQKKTWEKHTTEEQRNDPNWSVEYGRNLQKQAEELDVGPAAPEKKPEPEPEPEKPPTIDEEGINRDIYKDLPGDADETAKDRLFPWNKRKEHFAATEEANGRYAKLSDEIHSKNWYKEDYEERLKNLRAGDPNENPANEQIFEHNIKVHEEAIEKLESERKAIADDLISKGKMEFKEVQDLLRSRQTYIDDLTRRKEGSQAHWKDIAQITAHDRAIDQYRTGKKEGHFPGAEHDAMLAKRREDNRREYAERDRLRKEKQAADIKTRESQNVEALERLRKHGHKVSDEGKFLENPADDFEYPHSPGPNAKASEHADFLKRYKNRLQDKADMLQIRINRNTIDQGYASNYEEQELKELQWKNRHFIENHTMSGVVAFNDGDKSTFEDYQRRYHDSTSLAKSQVKEVRLYKTGGPRKHGRRSGWTTMGSWDNKGGVNLFYNSKAARKKMEAMGISKEDWHTTADHEFAHADWHALEKQRLIGQQYNDVQAAKNSFIADVNDEYNNENFKLHPYTDTYRGDRREDLLANEAHSKLREFEIDGSMERRIKTAEMSIQLAAEHGEPTSPLAVEQFVSAKGFLKLVDSYNDLRSEMRKL